MGSNPIFLRRENIIMVNMTTDSYYTYSVHIDFVLELKIALILYDWFIIIDSPVGSLSSFYFYDYNNNLEILPESVNLFMKNIKTITK